MKKLNLQMLHLGSALALLVGLLSAAAVNAQTLPHRTAACVDQKTIIPKCTTSWIRIDKGHLLHFGVVSRGPTKTEFSHETELKIVNDVGVMVINKRVLSNQAYNSRFRVTSDNRSFYAVAKRLTQSNSYNAAVAASISYHPTNLKAPTKQDQSAGGLFYFPANWD